MNTVERPIRSLFILPSLYRAGAETQLVDLVNGLSNKQFQKYLFTFEENLDQKDRLDTEHVTLYNQPRRYKFDLYPVKCIAQLIDKEKIEIIHCTQPFSLLLAFLGRLRSRRKPPIVTAIHSTYTYNLKEKLQKFLIYKYLLTWCTSDIIFVCQNQRNNWTKIFPPLAHISHVVYNGVDEKYFSPKDWITAGLELKKELKIPNDSQIVSCIASFRTIKGHSFLIEAFATLKHTPYLILAGDGQNRHDIEKQIYRHNLESRIKLLGNVEDVRPLLAMSDLTILPSLAETFSMAMLESMSMEVPLLATNVGGSGEAVLPNKTGFLVTPGSVEDLHRGLTEALGDPNALKAMGKACRRLVINHFSRDIMVNRTADVLHSALMKLHKL